MGMPNSADRIAFFDRMAAWTTSFFLLSEGITQIVVDLSISSASLSLDSPSRDFSEHRELSVVMSDAERPDATTVTTCLSKAL
eukprot:CAMPEP_0178827564 /NCGR_PEP_ID=MMETSP0746-20121128/7348_1 /TAXON_ID=913974 /ORGANISM="Nitzschia punctata, Strain CCMP561" /LENGTH=82 /DNA_ID=CAMNT_0020489455 /DNA_START=258 /DNA_END=506 /DNA_ORIENTATION=+